MSNTDAKKEYNRRYEKTLRKDTTMRIRIPKDLHTEIKIYAEEEKIDMWQAIKKGIDYIKKSANK